MPLVIEVFLVSLATLYAGVLHGATSTSTAAPLEEMTSSLLGQSYESGQPLPSDRVIEPLVELLKKIPGTESVQASDTFLE